MSDYYIPEPVMEQILLRLPPTTLARFCFVCKSWYSLITSNSFISSHLLHFSLPNPITITIPTAPLLRIKPKLHALDPYSCRLVDSLNGLLCLYQQNNGAVMLWNPSIRRYLELPLPLSPSFRNVAAIGFGFDSIHNDFKVIRFFFPVRVELYSLNRRSWREVNFPFSNWRRFSDTRCFLNGNVHWIMAWDTNFSHKSTNHLLMFNVAEEKFPKSKLPRNLFSRWLFLPSIMVIEGCISVLKCHENNNGSYDIWMMREYGVVESWNKVHTLRNVYNSVWRVFGLSTGGGVIELLRRHVSLHSFDLTSEEVKDLGTQGNIDVICACEYTESLALLDGYPIY